MKNLIDLISSILNVPSDKLNLESGPKEIPSWDSLGHVSLMSAVEQTYDLRFTMTEILSVKTINDLVKLIEKYGVNLTKK